jgi:hypothetical protein
MRRSRCRSATGSAWTSARRGPSPTAAPSCATRRAAAPPSGGPPPPCRRNPIRTPSAPAPPGLLAKRPRVAPRQFGFMDTWEVMFTAREAKFYMSICVCLQLLKIIKFTNVIVPKMSLMTSVLAKGCYDLLFFGIIFGLSMFAFCQLFYIQLGSFMDDYHSQTSSIIALALALFGDFPFEEILDNSRGYVNGILFLVYLFVAVFILLSMFLAILGEAQAAAREAENEAKEAGTFGNECAAELSLRPTASTSLHQPLASPPQPTTATARRSSQVRHLRIRQGVAGQAAEPDARQGGHGGGSCMPIGGSGRETRRSARNRVLLTPSGPPCRHRPRRRRGATATTSSRARAPRCRRRCSRCRRASRPPSSSG